MLPVAPHRRVSGPKTRRDTEPSTASPRNRLRLRNCAVSSHRPLSAVPPPEASTHVATAAESACGSTPPSPPPPLSLVAWHPYNNPQDGGLQAWLPACTAGTAPGHLPTAVRKPAATVNGRPPFCERPSAVGRLLRLLHFSVVKCKAARTCLIGAGPGPQALLAGVCSASRFCAACVHGALPPRGVWVSPQPVSLM